MKVSVTLALAALAVSLSPLASAEGFYGDVGYAFISADEDVDGDSFVVDLGAVAGHAGYFFTDNLGVEGELAFGVSDEEATSAGVSVSLGLNYLAGLYGVAALPVTEKLSLFARAGVVQAEVEAEASFAGTTFSESESETGYGLGVGGMFDLTENVYLRGDYTRYDIEDAEIDAFLIGVGFKY